MASVDGAICRGFAWDRRACGCFRSVLPFGGQIPSERCPDDRGNEQNPEKPIFELHFPTSFLDFVSYFFNFIFRLHFLSLVTERRASLPANVGWPGGNARRSTDSAERFLA